MTSPLSPTARRSTFGLLALGVVLINLRFLCPHYVPRHDTMYGFGLFHYFYSEFFFNDHIAPWLPFDSFGMPSYHDQLLALTPVSYLGIIIGRLLHVEDALLLFKITLVGEQMILLLGMYLLTGLLFSRPLTVFILSLAAVLHADIYSQLHFDFRIFYMFPLAAYFLLLFFKNKRPQFLWLTGLTILAWEMGAVLYFIALWGFLFLIMGLFWFFRDRGIMRCLFERSASNVILFSALTALAGAFYLHLKAMMAFIDLAARGPGGKNDLLTFLHWGGVDGLGTLVHTFLPGHTAASYIGLLPLIFFVWAAVYVRRRAFFAFLIPTIVLIWLSFGGIFSALCYYLPGIAFYRHIGLVYGLIKILIIICAGFGLEDFWPASLKQKTLRLLGISGLTVFALDAFRITGGWLTQLAYSDSPRQMIAEVLRINGPLLPGIGYLIVLAGTGALWGWDCLYRSKPPWAARPLSSGNIIPVLLLGAFLIDVLCFEWFAYRKEAELPEEYHAALYTLNVHRPAFQEERTQFPITQRQQDSFRLLTRPEAGSSYSAAHSFMQYDACRSPFFIHMHPKGLSSLLKTRSRVDPDLLRVLGCHAPKVRLVSRAVVFDTAQAAAKAMSGMPELYDTLILHGALSPSRPSEPAGRPGTTETSPGNIEILKFAAGELLLTAQVSPQEGAWLVYTDAWHPAWRAEVNGRRVQVHEAYLAFKAVRLGPGKSTVRFFYRSGLHTGISYLTALYGAAFSVWMIVLFGGVLIGDKEPDRLFS